jgi:predicted amidophosphoribosyltransferase
VKICPKCHKKSNRPIVYCSDDGSRMEETRGTCVKCGEKLDSSDKFCEQCGTKVAQ